MKTFKDFIAMKTLKDLSKKEDIMNEEKCKCCGQEIKVDEEWELAKGRCIEKWINIERGANNLLAIITQPCAMCEYHNFSDRCELKKICGGGSPWTDCHQKNSEYREICKGLKKIGDFVIKIKEMKKGINVEPTKEEQDDRRNQISRSTTS